MATTAPPAEAAVIKAQIETREYIVFGTIDGQPMAADGSPPAWTEVGRATAAKADDASNKVIDGLPVDEQGGPFVTIAARYWQPESFEVETKTTRKPKR